MAIRRVEVVPITIVVFLLRSREDGYWIGCSRTGTRSARLASSLVLNHRLRKIRVIYAGDDADRVDRRSQGLLMMNTVSQVLTTQCRALME